MARGKASSSDKLLEMIRGKKKQQQGAQAPAAKGAQPPPPPEGASDPGKKGGKAAGKKAGKTKIAKGSKPPKISSGFSAKGGGGKAVVIGVDLGSNSMHLAKSTGPVNKRKLLGLKHVPYEHDSPPGSAGFVNFLRDRLKDFAKGHRKYEVWTNISTAKAEIWNINIPKVSRKQITDAVYWSVKKEKQFDESEFILDFDVLGEVAEKGVPKLAVTVYLAPRKQVDEVVDLFSKAGFKLHGVTIAPTAIQSLFRTKWIEPGAGTYANLYVGSNWSRIDIFNQGNLVLSRGIKAGTNSMVESLMDAYNMEQGGSGGMSNETIVQDEPVISMDMDDEPIVLDDIPSQTMDGTSPGHQGMEFEQARQVLMGRLLEGKVPSGMPGGELDEGELVDMILPAAERLVRQIERTFEYHTTTMGNEPVEKIYFSGSICTNKLILQYMYSQLGIESLVLDPLHPENPNVGRMEGPESAVERMEYNLVVALALSDNSITPNLINTYKAKEKERQALGVDKAIYLVTIFALAVLAGVWMWQRDAIQEARREYKQLKTQLDAYQPRANEKVLLQLADKVSRMHLSLKKASHRYEGLSLLSELSEITPDHVKLLKVEMDLGPYVPLSAVGAAEQQPDQQQNQQKDYEKFVIMEGFIEGDEVDKFESAFTSFLIKLENSKMFATPQPVEEETKLEEMAHRGTVYKFKINIPVE